MISPGVACLVLLAFQEHEHHPPSEPQEPKHVTRGKDSLVLPHNRGASGTAWQPDSTPMHAVHFMEGEWMVMLHGNLFAGYDYQSGRRGGDQWMSTNWVMLMAQHPLAGGQIGLRSMLSLEPATIGRDGYPLLFQTGEALGGEPLHDVQHPHDLFMEMAATYTRPLNEDVGFQLYGAAVGEPALGPVAFMHRFSASSHPLAPLGHHWQDSTHISFGVLTAGIFTRHVKLEGSWFNGREPDENRWDFDFHRFRSYSGRLVVNLHDDVSVQVSAGHLDGPEILASNVDARRITASVTYNRPLGDEGNWATTVAWGRNQEEHEDATHSFLIETDLALDRHHVPFARIEHVRKSGDDLVLAPAPGEESFGMASLSAGYLYNFDPIGSLVPGLGFCVSMNLADDDLESFYGPRTPYGVMLFFRLWPDTMDHGDH